jgi:biopolymer transport protein ExbB
MDVLANIATITPLMGLLGTVIGMIKVFAEIMLTGTGQASLLAGGISEALITTAAGLLVAIPVLICHRWLQRKIDDSVVLMEQQSRRLLDVYMDSVESNEQPRAAVANRDHSL